MKRMCTPFSLVFEFVIFTSHQRERMDLYLHVHRGNNPAKTHTCRGYIREPTKCTNLLTNPESRIKQTRLSFQHIRHGTSPRLYTSTDENNSKNTNVQGPLWHHGQNPHYNNLNHEYPTPWIRLDTALKTRIKRTTRNGISGRRWVTFIQANKEQLNYWRR